MQLPPQLGPRRGFILAAILAMAAADGLKAAEADATATPAPAVATEPSAATINGTVTAAPPKTPSTPEIDLSEVSRFLDMPNERLEKLRKGIEYIEKMPTAEREALRHEIQARGQNAWQLNEEIRKDLQALPPPESNVIRRYVMAIFSEEIPVLTKRFKDASTPEARQKIIQEMLKAAADKGIKAEPNQPNFGGPPPNGSRGGNGQRGGGRGPGNDNGRGGPRNGPPPPIPPPASHE